MSRAFAPDGRYPGSIRLGLSLKGITPILYQSQKHILLMTAVLLAFGILSFFIIFQIQDRHFSKIREMEEQMRLQEELSAMGQLAAGVAHEIKNPLMPSVWSYSGCKRSSAGKTPKAAGIRALYRDRPG